MTISKLTQGRTTVSFTFIFKCNTNRSSKKSCDNDWNGASGVRSLYRGHGGRAHFFGEDISNYKTIPQRVGIMGISATMERVAE